MKQYPARESTGKYFTLIDLKTFLFQFINLLRYLEFFFSLYSTQTLLQLSFLVVQRYINAGGISSLFRVCAVCQSLWWKSLHSSHLLETRLCEQLWPGPFEFFAQSHMVNENAQAGAQDLTLHSRVSLQCLKDAASNDVYILSIYGLSQFISGIKQTTRKLCSRAQLS